MKSLFLLLGLFCTMSMMMSGASAIYATGGTITNLTYGEGNYTIHTFTSSGTFTPTADGYVEILVIGGGGGGGYSSYTGGGGGGGFANSSSYYVYAQPYSVLIGAGGIGGVNGDQNGKQGGNTTFNRSIYVNITAFGGGGASGIGATAGLDGGSGGGGTCNFGAGGTAIQGASDGATGFGSDGGAAGGSYGGGGGGAGGAGEELTAGIGKSSNISGSNLVYSRGGFGGGTVVNGTSGDANTGMGGNYGGNVVNGGAGGSGIVVVRYFNPYVVSIFSPSNQTYYNNFTLPLNVSNNTFDADEWFYSWNNVDNVSFTPNTTIEIQQGSNILWISVNDTSGNWYFNSISFAMRIACNSTWNNVSICGGWNSMYIIPCANNSGTWQWSDSNITQCDGVCKNGVCLSPRISCTNQCNVSADQKSCGGNNNRFIINCTYDRYGCQIWNGFNASFCPYGCSGGYCQNCTNKCKLGEVRCYGDDLYHCVSRTNCTEFDMTNITHCTYGCGFNHTSGIEVDYCNYHSFNQTYGLAEGLEKLGSSINYLVPSNVGRSTITFIISLIIGIIIIYYTRSWMVGLVATIGIMWIAAFGGWFDAFQLLFYTLIAIFILWLAMKGGGDEE